MNLEESQWRTHPEFPHILVSSTGQIMSCRVKNGAFVPRSLNKSGDYYSVIINGKRKMVHRLVAETYLPCENSDSLVVNHIDGNKLNNDVRNLEWCTQSDNVKRAYSDGYSSHSKRVRIIETGEEFVSAAECARHICGNAAEVRKVLRGERLSYKGLHFELI